MHQLSITKPRPIRESYIKGHTDSEFVWYILDFKYIFHDDYKLLEPSVCSKEGQSIRESRARARPEEMRAKPEETSVRPFNSASQISGNACQT